MINTHRPLLVAIVEPFVNADRGASIRDQLGFDEFVANDEESSKIWVFSKNTAQMEVISIDSQALTVRVFDSEVGSKMAFTIVYASCDGGERRLLWEHLFSIMQMELNVPWFVVDDFNTVLSNSGKKSDLCSPFLECYSLS